MIGLHCLGGPGFSSRSVKAGDKLSLALMVPQHGQVVERETSSADRPNSKLHKSPKEWSELPKITVIGSVDDRSP